MRVGFIGLGTMGAHMALNVRAAGHELVVHNCAGYAIQTALAEVFTSVANLTHAEMTEALNRGWAGRDSRVAMLLQEERAGVAIKVPAAAIEAVLERDG